MGTRVEVHTQYKVEEDVVPSVTSIIHSNLGWSTQALIGWAFSSAKKGLDPYEIRDQSGRIGTIAHALVEENLTGELSIDLDEYSPNDVEKARVAYGAFETWLAAGNEIEVKYSELPLTSDEYVYGGTIDFVGKLNGEPALIDFKTSSRIYASHRIQVAAYVQLYEENYGERLPAHILHLDKKTGHASHQPLTDLSDEWRAFEILLELNKLKDKIE